MGMAQRLRLPLSLSKLFTPMPFTLMSLIEALEGAWAATMAAATTLRGSFTAANPAAVAVLMTRWPVRRRAAAWVWQSASPCGGFDGSSARPRA